VKRTLLLLAVAGAAFAAAPAAQAGPCAGPAYFQTCVSYGCTGDPCRIDPTTITVTQTCEHPLPASVCNPK
jgi:hypothetical protein